MRMPRSAMPLVLLAATAGGLLLAGCSDSDGGGGGGRASAAELVQSDAPRAGVGAEAQQGAADAGRAFASDLYAVLARDSESNLVFSPYSALVALAMTRAGAEGDTASQTDAVLHAALASDLHAGLNAIDQALAERSGEFPLGDGGTADLELSMANQLWGQRDFEFEAPFLDLLAAQYGAGMRLVDFVEATEEARTAINEWVSERTNERIPELIAPGVLNEMTRLVLTNAVYLKAPWLYRFDHDLTESAPFTRLDGSQVEAEMMGFGGHKRISFGQGADFEAVRLPYVGGSLSMIVVVPAEGQYETFEAGFDAAKLDAVVKSLGTALVDLRMPRFEFRTQAALKDALSELGMPIAFEAGAADFSGMNPEQGRDLFIRDVIHEAFIAVDEDGTEAAAASAVVMEETSLPPSFELTIDRPFLFLVHDQETDALLFMGRVLDPTQE